MDPARRVELDLLKGTAPRSDVRGRGTATNAAGRFERFDFVPDEPDAAAGPTTYVVDRSRTAVTFNDSPDVPFDASVNPYRGCAHGCPYCFARPTHEYLGLSAGLDFERVIFVKPDVAALLRAELSSPRWRPQPVAVSTVTDCYQPIERKLGLTRGVLEALRDFRNPVGIITKNALVTRDLDLLAELASHGAARVDVTLTTLDNALSADMEPRASAPRARLEAVRRLREAGVPVGVTLSPIVPGLTDHEVPALLAAAAEAGAGWANLILLRLPGAVSGLFLDWLRRRRPERAGRVEAAIRSVRGGRLNDARFGSRFRGEGVLADQIRQMFALHARRHGLARGGPRLEATAFRVPGRAEQLSLF